MVAARMVTVMAVVMSQMTAVAEMAEMAETESNGKGRSVIRIRAKIGSEIGFVIARGVVRSGRWDVRDSGLWGNGWGPNDDGL